MPIRRLVATAAAMAGIAVALAALTPAFPAMTGAITGAQRTVDTQGSDVLIASAAGLLAWSVWVWGAVGLALTAASALPGVVGCAARLALNVALPAGARRSAAVLLGIGLGLAAPVAVAAVPVLVPSASAAPSAAVQDVPDWPAPAAATAPAAPAAATPLPDWPGAAPASAPAPASGIPASVAPTLSERVVVRGDCLWDIAADSLLAQLGRLPSDGETAAAVDAWWRANADVIGRDPDLLLPGQVLRAPGPP